MRILGRPYFHIWPSIINFCKNFPILSCTQINFIFMYAYSLFVCTITKTVICM